MNPDRNPLSEQGRVRASGLRPVLWITCAGLAMAYLAGHVDAFNTFIWWAVALARALILGACSGPCA